MPDGRRHTFSQFGAGTLVAPDPPRTYLGPNVIIEPLALVREARHLTELGVRDPATLLTIHPRCLVATPWHQPLNRLRELGHGVGLHAVWPGAERDERFDPVVAWHNPDPDYMSEPLDGVVNVMQPPYFDPGHYRSDSNQRWRHGCPHESLTRREFAWLQLLVHPEIWVYPGETMRETMDAMLDAERERRRALLAEDRIDLS